MRRQNRKYIREQGWGAEGISMNMGGEQKGIYGNRGREKEDLSEKRDEGEQGGISRNRDEGNKKVSLGTGIVIFTFSVIRYLDIILFGNWKLGFYFHSYFCILFYDVYDRIH